MNEELDSQLSAMYDDELPAAECELLARRLSRDELLKARWGRYAVIGSAIRAERNVSLSVNLSSRVRAAIEHDAPLAAVPAPSRRAAAVGGIRWWQPVAGVGVAAGVAALSLLWLRGQAPEVAVAETSTPAPLVLVDNTATTPVNSPESYVTPVNTEPPGFMPTAELANYVVAHSEVSAPFTRRNLLSALMASESGTVNEPDESASGSPSDSSIEASKSDVQKAQ